MRTERTRAIRSRVIDGIDLYDIEVGGEEGRAWTVEEAGALISELQPHLHAVGWYFTVAGSTLTKGIGRDLDLVGVPVFLNAEPREWLIATLAKRGWTIIEHHRSSYDRVVQVVFETENMRLIDLMLWRTANDEPFVQSERDARLEDAIHEAGGMGV